MQTKIISFQTITFFADGEHINFIEVFDSAKEAIERAEAWIELGYIAKAVIVVIDILRHEVDTYPLT